ncbi:hypothetical protein SAMN04515648_1172 [Phyllobacterium sp. CL33Tsu]|uniref:hypothetical protein n=1 Tax=Phyllobacterium sp. CL33Tsu TaxID=1798191 RepID=UPI0008EB3FB0|nr:hypothetical protein [Phyllobacterium sp. CL33Tsu]SFI68748.1 hypothetical protein SAMN04515648_1172 [Phyllobacterium sp. CL33Tsu]
MIQWMKLEVTRACLIGVLLATTALAGCNKESSNDAQLPPESTFAAKIDSAKPDSTPLTEPIAPSGSTAEVPSVTPIEPTPTLTPESDEKITRFTSVAPDITAGKYTPSLMFYYNLGNLVTTPEDYPGSKLKGVSTMLTPIRGSVRYPDEIKNEDGAKYPVIILVHDTDTTDAKKVIKNHHQGFDYLVSDFVSQGYVVFSIDAEEINSWTEFSGNNLQSEYDKTGVARAQLVMATLDKLRFVNEKGDRDSTNSPGVLNVLKGKLDLERIGLVGHGRGGAAVANAINFNKTRLGATEGRLKAALLADASSVLKYTTEPFSELANTVSGDPAVIDDAKFKDIIKRLNISYAAGTGEAAPHNIKAALMLAPSDRKAVTGLTGMPWAVVVAGCDKAALGINTGAGNLAGGPIFDRSRFGPAEDASPHFQLFIRGANSGAYNTIQKPEPAAATVCNHPVLGPRLALNGDDQRNNARFIIGSFMRLFVGGEKAFAPYWNGQAQLPPSACPGGKGTCDERVLLTIQKDAGNTTLIQRYETPAAATVNQLGGVFSLKGFTQAVQCPMAPEGCYSWMPKLFDNLQTASDRYQLFWWDKNATITTELKGLSTAGRDYLTFRAALVHDLAIGQEILVTLTDGKGKSATVEASDFTDVLYQTPRPKGDGRPMIIDPLDMPSTMFGYKENLHMIAIPLRAFKGIDTTNLSKLELVLPKEVGRIALGEIELQNFGRFTDTIARN